MLSDRVRAGYVEGSVSILVNAVLFLVKLYAGLLFNSIAVIADAVHTLSDCLTSLVVIVGFKVSSKKPDSEHPFGHGRAEVIAALVIGVALGFTAYEISAESFRKIVEGSPLHSSILLVVLLLASGIVKEVLAEWAFKLAGKYRSQSIRSDAWHHRTDAVLTLALAVALLIGGEYWWLDGVAGLLISLFVLYTAIKLVLESSSMLLGKAPSRDLIERIEQLAKSTSPLVLSVHHIHVHEYGEHVEVTLHIDLPDNITLEEAHKVASLVEERIKSELGYVATAHVEPVTSKRAVKHED
jgi:cation diffusion facilitator family transporter